MKRKHSALKLAFIVACLLGYGGVLSAAEPPKISPEASLAEADMKTLQEEHENTLFRQVEKAFEIVLDIHEKFFDESYYESANGRARLFYLEANLDLLDFHAKNNPDPDRPPYFRSDYDRRIPLRVERAEKLRSSERKRYEQGKTMLSDLLDAEARFTAARLAELDLKPEDRDIVSLKKEILTEHLIATGRLRGEIEERYALGHLRVRTLEYQEIRVHVLRFRIAYCRLEWENLEAENPEQAADSPKTPVPGIRNMPDERTRLRERITQTYDELLRETELLTQSAHAAYNAGVTTLHVLLLAEKTRKDVRIERLLFEASPEEKAAEIAAILEEHYGTAKKVFDQIDAKFRYSVSGGGFHDWHMAKVFADELFGEILAHKYRYKKNGDEREALRLAIRDNFAEQFEAHGLAVVAWKRSWNAGVCSLHDYECVLETAKNSRLRQIRFEMNEREQKP